MWLLRTGLSIGCSHALWMKPVGVVRAHRHVMLDMWRFGKLKGNPQQKKFKNCQKHHLIHEKHSYCSHFLHKKHLDDLALCSVEGSHGLSRRPGAAGASPGVLWGELLPCRAELGTSKWAGDDWREQTSLSGKHLGQGSPSGMGSALEEWLLP